MKKILAYVLLGIAALAIAYYAFIYFVPYSEGTRAGELIKFSNRGVMVKTWEGQISQGISGAQIFSFSVLDQDDEVIEIRETYLHRTLRNFYFLGRYQVFCDRCRTIAISTF